MSEAAVHLGPEHEHVRLPTIDQLLALGSSQGQLPWKPAWSLPRSPNDAAKREVGYFFAGRPVDLVIFDRDEHAAEWEHVQAIFEFKRRHLERGLSQLEIHLNLEPRARYGFWTSGTETAALYKTADI